MKIIPSQPFMFMLNKQTRELIEKRNIAKALGSDQTTTPGISLSDVGLHAEEDGDVLAPIVHVSVSVSVSVSVDFD
jgi:hypothetical protein